MTKKDFSSNIRIKDATKGEVSAVFSTFDVIDKDGDVTPADAITDGAPIVVSAYGHQSWAGALPVGKGTISVTKSEAIANMQFFMDTTQGRDTFNAVAELAKSGLGEWSYGFDIVEAEAGVFDGKDVRVLKSLDVHEVSPVLRGAGVGTRTLSAKGAKDSNVSNAAYRSAIRPHETGFTNAPWDAVKSLNAIPASASVTDLRGAFAYVDSSNDPEAKSSYKFLHHDADGKANVRACIAHIAQLNGAMKGGTGVPDEDRRGVYNHLMVHLQEADFAVPELRTLTADSALKFLDEIDAVQAQLFNLVSRATGVMALRATKGRMMSPDALERLSWIHESMRDLKAIVDSPAEALAVEYVRFVGSLNNIGDHDNA
jgi:hypothetical protein